MATFRTGQQTDRAVLPQRSALEFDPADNPGNRDETGIEDHHPHTVVVPGAGHVRGETRRRSPTPAGVTPNRQVGEKARECQSPVPGQPSASHPAVFVLDKHGTALQPCHPARARKLLKSGRAVVARRTPLVIRIKDRTAAESEIDGVEVGIDPGSRHTGIAVFTVLAGERRGRYGPQLDHRGGRIRKAMAQRSAYRRGRRPRNLRYRAPRFSNRARPAGWLAPSLRHRVDSTISWIDRLCRWAPVRAVHLETASFDTHALSAGRLLRGVEYQQGTLQGFEVREYLLTKWNRKCAYCGASEVPLNIDHVHPRSRGGSDRVSNLTIACVSCNQEKGNQPVEEFLANRPKALARIMAQAMAPLADAAALNATRRTLWRSLATRLPTHVTTGGRTKWNRARNNLPKTHTLDALAVGELHTITAYPTWVLVAGCTGRGTYARTRPDRYGFPRLRLPRQKTFFGFTTGDLARAVVPSGKKAGTHVGRVAVRATGSFNIATAHGTIQGIGHRHFRLLQRADGYAYTTRGEGSGVPSLA